jgi:hypothetical protein
MQKLAKGGYVRYHQRGLPPRTQWGAWRITNRGVGAMLDRWPDEPIPNNLVERVAEGSLYRICDDEPMARLYFDLIAPDPYIVGGAPRVLHCRQWAIEVHRRASAITWLSRGEVVIE